MTKKEKPCTCSFCKRSKETKDSLILVAGDGVAICNECMVLVQEIFSKSMVDEEGKTSEKDKTDLKNLTPRQIVQYLDDYVIGQDATKKTLAIAVYNHYRRLEINAKNKENTFQKSNILLVGSTGSGKTHTISTLARFLGVPFAIADATTITEAGYVGEDAENIIARLLENAEGDIEKAQKGIVYIDEIDKIARKGENASITRDVSGEGVQHALLKIIEGTVCSVAPIGSRKVPNQSSTMIDTSNILFICGGAFDGLPKIINARTQDQSSIGFNAPVAAKKDNTSYEALSKIETQDLIKFGLVPELVGRLPIITTLQDLDKDALKNILSKPKNALVKQFQDLFTDHKVELKFTDDALTTIAEEAIAKKTGARGLRSIVERVLSEPMFILPEMEKGTVIEINSDVVKGKIDAIQIHVDKKRA